MAYPLIGGSTPGVSPKHEVERSINWYPVLPESPKARPHLRGRPGLSLLATLSRTPIRGVHSFNDRFFCVAGAGIYEVNASGTVTEWGTIPSVYGDVSMASLTAANDTTIVIGDGSGYFALDLTAGTVEKIVDAPRGRFCVYHKNRILYQGENGQVFYSELLDPTNIPGLNFYTAESLPDEINALVSVENIIYHFGPDSVEPWYNSGDANNPFEPIPSGISFNGCAFPNTALRLDNSVFWVGRDKEGSGIVYRMNGTTGMRVSTSVVERDMTGTVSAYSYQEDGHTFYCLNTASKTWAFDLKTQLWHERTWLNRNTGIEERHRVQHHAYALGGHVVTDYANGKVYLQGLDYHSDAGQEIRRTRVDGFEVDGRAIIIDELFLDFVTGTGLITGQGSNPKVMLEVAPDGAKYGNELMADMGAIGDYKNRVRFHRLGRGTDFKFKISVSDPVITILKGGDIKARVGNR